MTVKLYWAKRCVVPPGGSPQGPVGGGVHALLGPTPRRHLNTGELAASPSPSPLVCNGLSKRSRTTTSQDRQEPWNRDDFESLQTEAASRLPRFYVPQPLGPASPENPLLEALLAGAATTASASHTPGPAAAAATVAPGSSSSRRRRPVPTRDAEPSPSSSFNPSSFSSSSSSAAAVGAASSSFSSSSLSSSSSSSSPSSNNGPSLSALGRPSSAAATPTTVVLEGGEARHAARALRLQPGDRVQLCDGRGNLVEAAVAGSDRQRVWVAPDAPSVHVSWVGSRWVVAVACTTLKGGRAEWLVEKLTELGASMIVPLVTERSQAGGKAKFRTHGGGSETDGGEFDGDYQPGRLERVAIAATKQSLRPHALRLAPPTPLADVLSVVRLAMRGVGGADGAATLSGTTLLGEQGGEDGDAKDGQLGVAVAGVVAGQDRVGWTEGGSPAGLPGERAESAPEAARGGDGPRAWGLVAVAGAPSLASVLNDLRKGLGNSGAAKHAGKGSGQGAAEEPLGSPLRFLFIGPEGDFTPVELAALVEAGARPVGLGENRLRTETAAVALLAACMFSENGS